MKLEYLKDKNELISIALLGFSAVMAVFILLKVTSFFTDSARAENVVRTALDNINSDSNDVEQYFVKDQEVAESLTANNLFAPPASRENPVKEVRAIFDDQAFINNNWYSEGQTVPGDAKIVAIEPTRVLIEWDGRQSYFSPLDATIPESQGSDRTRTRAGVTGRESAQMTTIGTQPGQMTGRGPMGIDFQDIRSRFQGMSNAERERLRNEMVQRFGGNRALGGGRGSGGFGGGRGGGRGGRGGGRGGRGG